MNTTKLINLVIAQIEADIQDNSPPELYELIDSLVSNERNHECLVKYLSNSGKESLNS